MCELFTLLMFFLNAWLAYDHKKMKYQEAKEEENWQRRNNPNYVIPEVVAEKSKLKIYKFPSSGVKDDKPGA